MSLVNLLEEHATQHANNILTDGHITCTYADLPPLLAQMDAVFAQHGIEAGVDVVFECSNTVRAAVTLIYLISRGISFMLLPPTGDDEKALTLKPLPRFCTHRVRIHALDKSDTNLSPASFLWIEPNPQFEKASDLAVGNLYLRTSGSMGESKIVVHRLDKLLGNALNVARKYDFLPSDRVIIPVPIFHMYGFGAEFLPSVLVGANMDLLENTNVLNYLSHEKAFKPTILYVTPTLAEILMQGFRSPRHYKAVVTSGQRIGEELFVRFNEKVGNTLVNQYGSSEGGGIAACAPTDSVELRTSTIGTPMTGVRLELINETPEGIGELQVYHPYKYVGYLNERGEWLHQEPHETPFTTGDLAKRLPNGSIQVVGRAKNSINRNGYLILFSDIEKMMETIEGVVQVVIVQIPGETVRGETIAACCIVKPTSNWNATTLREKAFDVLPRYAVPDHVQLLERFPLLPSGKIDQQTLKKMIQVE